MTGEPAHLISISRRTDIWSCEILGFYRNKRFQVGFMEKLKNKKMVFIIAGVVLLVAAVVIIMILFKKEKKNKYRLLKVYTVEGEANVNRAGKGDITPYENMVLESGDRVSLTSGDLVLQADKDKYIHLSEGTELVLKASGNDKRSNIQIDLLQGAITSDIQSALSEDSSYDVNTPNSTMSVRGTVFYVYIYEVNGIKYTRVCVFDGKVTTKLVYKDGTVAENEVEVGKGKEVTIFENETTVDYLSDPTDIDYDSLDEGTLVLLQVINDDGRELSITNDDLKNLLETTYTVTFMYNGQIFGVQTVIGGQKVTQPSLKPAATGSWSWDFSKPIDHNIIVEWK